MRLQNSERLSRYLLCLCLTWNCAQNTAWKGDNVVVIQGPPKQMYTHFNERKLYVVC